MDVDTPLLPSLIGDGIILERAHLPRLDLIQQALSTAREYRYVVLGTPAATGKTSLIQLLQQTLDGNGAKVIRMNMNSAWDARHYLELLKGKGVDVTDHDSLKGVQNTWVLIDDAQRCYDSRFDPVWEAVVKDISSVGTVNLFVVIAATYDITTPESPACFTHLPHLATHMSEQEAHELLEMHFGNLGFENPNFRGWNEFRSTQLKMSVVLPVTATPKFHAGVLMAGILYIDARRKEAGRDPLTEREALEFLRSSHFVDRLKRCFGLRKPEELPSGYKERLLDALLGLDKNVKTSDDALGPFIRAGVLTNEGKFSTVAASWFYNDQCFPNRAMVPPASLDALVVDVVRGLSAGRLSDTLENGFPKEATFQHLFNEEISKRITSKNKLIPELNTKAEPTDDGDGTGSLDFYINGNLNWCLELLRLGSKVGNHLARFDPNGGKYRYVPTKQYLVVDCRGPKIGKGCEPHPSRCTLYFSKNFETCVCQMREEEEVTLRLSL